MTHQEIQSRQIKGFTWRMAWGFFSIFVTLIVCTIRITNGLTEYKISKETDIRNALNMGYAARVKDSVQDTKINFLYSNAKFKKF